MTPFGNALSSLRRSRRFQQYELAALIGVQPCYISAMENGKKGPPSLSILDKLKEAFNLSKEELEKLEDSVQQSQKVVRLPDNTSLEEFIFISQLKKRLGSLSTEELSIMTNTLKLGSYEKDGGSI